MTRLKLIWWAIRGRPIIHRVKFKGGFEIVDTHHALISENTIIL